LQVFFLYDKLNLWFEQDFVFLKVEPENIKGRAGSALPLIEIW